MTTQINIQLEEHLLKEIDAISSMLHIPRSDWLRMKLAEAVKETILNYREALVLEYTVGHITFEELRVVLGSDADEVKLIHEMTLKGKKEIDKLQVK